MTGTRDAHQYAVPAGRIGRAFARRFRELLAEFGARDRDKGVRWLFSRAEASRRGRDLSRALAEQNIVLVRKLRRFELRRQRAPAAGNFELICDAGLGGLARWLRASGWKAHWQQEISDAELVAQAQRRNAIIVTTDSFILDRRPVARGEVRAIWVPPTLTRFEQLRLVEAELGTSSEDSRCMRCGGTLREVDKEQMRERIPPKTYRWVDEYYECEECRQLFWQGTHWQRITDRLRADPGR